MIPLYRTDPYLFSHPTIVDGLGEDNGTHLVTCREQIFAEGGGQPADRGSVGWNGAVQPVLELVKQKGNTLLRIEPIVGLKKGETVDCQIDPERRLRIMRLHTAQHGLAGALRRIDPGYESGGMTIDEAANLCTMRFKAPGGGVETAIDSAAVILNQAIAEGRLVRTEIFESAAIAAAALGELLRPSDPRVVLKGRARVVIIEGLDANACGGTHLRNLAEAGGIVVSDVGSERESGGSFVTFSLAG